MAEIKVVTVVVTHPDGVKCVYVDGKLVQVLYPPREGGTW